MSNLQIPDWSKLADPKGFEYRVDDINAFSITASFPAVADWDNPKLRALLHDRLHDDVTKLLREAEFFSDNMIEQRKGADYFAIEFKDDEFDFEIICYHNRIVLRKTGIQLRTFHQWYYAAIPGIKRLFDSVLSVMSKELGRNQSITAVSYRFDFIAYDFRDRGNQLKNFNVLTKLITHVPDGKGEIQRMAEDQTNISRLDYNVMCWDGSSKEDRRRLLYSVEAPANKSYAGLWFHFGYASDTYKDPNTGDREWIEPAILLDEFDRAYEFVWKRGIGGFMKSLLSDLQFKTTATYIP